MRADYSAVREMALPQKSFSFTPGFSLVLRSGAFSETVLTVSAGKEGQNR